MKYSINFIILLFAFSSFQLHSQDYSEITHSFNHLLEVNKQWAKNKTFSPDGLVHFESDNDRISFHLSNVIDILKQNAPTNLNQEAKKNRYALLELLSEYAILKVFPINNCHSDRQPYFIDDFGTYCAVGFLMVSSGDKSLAHKVSEEFNYSYIENITTKGVSEWSITNGFTLDELAWIQPSYPPAHYLTAFPSGIHGPINKLNTNNGIYFVGDFDTLDDFSCLNIGTYSEDQFSCVGEGVEGTILDISTFPNIKIIGTLINDDQTYPYANFEDNTWNFVGIPGRMGASATAFKYNGSNLLLCINHPEIPNQQEIWELNQSSWQKLVTVNGLVNSITYFNGNYYFGGHFDSAIIEELQTEISVNNVIIRNEGEWQTIEGEICDTVKVMKQIGNSLYIGGSSASYNINGQRPVLSKYLNSNLQTLIYNNHIPTAGPYVSINTISNDATAIYIGGYFQIIPIIGTYGQNLARYNVLTGEIESIADLNGQVNHISRNGSNYYVCGKFTSNLNISMNYIASSDFITTSTESIIKNSVSIFPNPVNESLNIMGLIGQFEYQIFNIGGKIITNGNSTDNKVDTNHLPKGSYILRLKSDKKHISLKFVKQ